jgi:hypothetical protein
MLNFVAIIVAKPHIGRELADFTNLTQRAFFAKLECFITQLVINF